MAQLAGLVIALLAGIMIGFILPAFIQMYKISQFAYGKGYESGKYVVGALVRRSLLALECRHAVPGRKETGPVCRSCAAEARKHLEKITVDL